MGKKVNIYLDDATLAMWTKIPAGERSGIIREAIQEHVKRGPSDPNEEAIRQLRHRRHRLSQEMRLRDAELRMVDTELDRLQGRAEVQVDKDVFWAELMTQAEAFEEVGMTYSSFTDKSRYQIHSTEENRIRILNQRTKKTTSHFSQVTVDEALDRLIAAGGHLPVGQFIPVKMHEYAVVALHPRLFVRLGIIQWRQEEMVPVQEEMIPEQDDGSGGPPPGDWVSNEHWLAVTVDGRRGHVTINNRCFASSKIMFELIDDDHPTMNWDTSPWQTKRFIFRLPGMLVTGAGTHEILMPKDA